MSIKATSPTIKKLLENPSSVTWQEPLATAPCLRFIHEELIPRLDRTTDELTNLLRGLSGRFVPAGPSGAPTRGMARILPTGRNFYSIDIHTIPTETAWKSARRRPIV